MKKLFLFTVCVLAVCRLAAQDEPRPAYERLSGGIQIVDDNEGRQAPTQTRIVFWTNTTVQGFIKVYFNGSFVGKITRACSSVPRCGASGCVTVTVTRQHNTWYGVASDGTRWESDHRTLATGCNAIRLYSTGRRSSGTHAGGGSSGGSAGGGSGSGSGSGSGYEGSDLQRTAEELGTAAGVALGYALSQGKGWDTNCNRIDAGVGYGIDYGGLGLKINYQAPVVFGITAGYGWNPGYGNHPGDDKKYHWNVGLQLWATDHWNFELGVGPRYFKKFDQTQTGISVMTHYQHQIWGRLGLIGGIGGSLSTSTPDGYEKKEIDGRFEWNVGIVFRLLR